nr:MAG TPA: hypothetical protein [Caudoviricetes sp.]
MSHQIWFMIIMPKQTDDSFLHHESYGVSFP